MMLKFLVLCLAIAATSLVIVAANSHNKTPPKTLRIAHQPHLHKFAFKHRITHAMNRVRGLANIGNVPASTVPIEGAVAIYGEYFVKVALGNPQDQLYLQVDTGSTDLLVYGEGCDGCPPEADKYNWGSSKTAVPQPCKGASLRCDKCYNNTLCAFDDGYGDGSDVTGFVLNDTFALVGLEGPSATVTMGSIQYSTSNFEPIKVDGIFGLAYSTTSAWGGESPLISFMKENNYYLAFSMCLHNDSGSSLTVGIDAHSNPNIAWSPRVFKAYYSVTLESMMVSGQALKVPPKSINGKYGALVDSGTTLIILPTPVFTALKAAFKANCSAYKLPGVCGVKDKDSIFAGNCFDMTEEDKAHFPDFSVKVKGIDKVQTIGSVKYLVHQGNELCLGIVPSGDEDVTILGDTFMRGFYFVFDQVTNSVGFADQSQCPE
jgi:hypothetical protein